MVAKLGDVRVRLARLAIMLPGAAMLVIGMLAGLARMGVIFIEETVIKDVHAPAMIYGFVASLIVLERAVAIRRKWVFIGPLFLSFGTLILLAPLPVEVGKALIAAGFVTLLIIYRLIWLRQKSIATAIQTLGAIAGLVSVLLWIAGLRFEKVAVMAALFLVLTIVGERVELGRVGGLTLNGERVGLTLSITVAFMGMAAIIWPDPGHVALGASIIVLVIWLFVVDVARTTIAATGAARFMAVSLLCGYVWLVVAGATWLVGAEPQGKMFDITTHAVLLGFVMSMIMAHASVILPAVLRVRLPYRAWFYVPLMLLQASLIARIAGDLRADDLLIEIGGVGNVLAIVIFLLSALISAVLATRASSKARA